MSWSGSPAIRTVKQEEKSSPTSKGTIKLLQNKKRNRRESSDEESDSDEIDQKPGTSTRNSASNNSKKKKKKNRVDEDEDSINGTLAIPITEMRRYVKSLVKKFGPESGAKDHKLHSFSAWDTCDYVPPVADTGILKTEMSRYLRRATLASTIRLRVALLVVDDFLSNPESLQLYPDFPQKPPHSYQIHMQNSMKGIPKNGVSQASRMKEMSETWKENASIRQKCTAEAARLQKEYANELEKFEHRHKDDLPPNFRAHLQKIRSEVVKAMKRSDKAGDTPLKKKVKMEPAVRKTAFDYYKQTMKNKYTDMEAEKRERKLLRRFEKLEEEEKSIFKSLEDNQ